LSTGAKTDIITKKEVAKNNKIPNNNKPDVKSKAVDEKDIWDFPVSQAWLEKTVADSIDRSSTIDKNNNKESKDNFSWMEES
jgi:hypothetical protein